MSDESLLDERTERELRSLFAELESPVKLVYFTQPHECIACREQHRLLEEVAALSDRLTLEVHELVPGDALAERYGIDKVPATAIVGAKDHGIRFYGLTAGYEFSTLVEDIMMVGRGSSGLPEEIEALVRRIEEPAHLEVLVTMTCPYCPQAVHLAHQMAMANDNIRADMVDASEFPELVQRYRVQGVPLTVANGRRAFDGARSPAVGVLEILRVAAPAEHERLQALLAERGSGSAV